MIANLNGIRLFSSKTRRPEEIKEHIQNSEEGGNSLRSHPKYYQSCVGAA